MQIEDDQSGALFYPILKIYNINYPCNVVFITLFFFGKSIYFSSLLALSLQAKYNCLLELPSDSDIYMFISDLPQLDGAVNW